MSDPLIDETDPRLAPRIPGTLQTTVDIRKDDKGRLELEFMTREDKINEILVTMRATQDLVQGFIESMSSGGGMMGMVKGLMGGGSIMGNRS